MCVKPWRCSQGPNERQTWRKKKGVEVNIIQKCFDVRNKKSVVKRFWIVALA